jgi:hypothetical protein
MKIEISLFATVVMLILLHTVLTHLFNWGWRKTINIPKESTPSILIVFFAIVEMLLLLITLLNLLP